MSLLSSKKCKHWYDVRWEKPLDNRCPAIVHHHNNQTGVYPTFAHTHQTHWQLIDNYTSLPGMWSEWNRQYYKAPYPRLMVRFEDALYRLEDVIKAIRECIGDTSNEPLEYLISSAKSHGKPEDFVAALAKYVTSIGRHRAMNEEDRKYANRALDPELMKIFQYEYAPVEVPPEDMEGPHLGSKPKADSDLWWVPEERRKAYQKTLASPLRAAIVRGSPGIAERLKAARAAVATAHLDGKAALARKPPQEADRQSAEEKLNRERKLAENKAERIDSILLDASSNTQSKGAASAKITQTVPLKTKTEVMPKSGGLEAKAIARPGSAKLEPKPKSRITTAAGADPVIRAEKAVAKQLNPATKAQEKPIKDAGGSTGAIQPKAKKVKHSTTSVTDAASNADATAKKSIQTSDNAVTTKKQLSTRLAQRRAAVGNTLLVPQPGNDQAAAVGRKAKAVGAQVITAKQPDPTRRGQTAGVNLKSNRIVGSDTTNQKRRNAHEPGVLKPNKKAPSVGALQW